MTTKILKADILRLVVAAVALSLNGACSQRTAPPATPQPAVVAHALPDGIRWVRESAEYRASTLQVYRQATAALVTAAAQAKGPWAVVLDADETVISNLQYQIERAQAGLAYSDETWRAWVLRREATPVPGASAFLARVHELGGRIAIVTNRLQSVCPDTEAVFKAQRLAYDVMLCRPDGTTSDKNPRFAAVAAGTTSGGGPRDILVFVGDNVLDFPGLTQSGAKQNDAALDAFGVKYFMLPNPMYGSWQ